MEGIKKIPVIGYLFRIVWNLFTAPKNMESVYGMLDSQLHRIDLQQAAIERQQAQIAGLQADNSAQQAQIDAQRNQIADLTAALERTAADLRNSVYDNWNSAMTPEHLQDLNLRLSINPTLWGDTERLHISERAAMGSCFFNVNSGSITVGDYSFAGSGVSLLAGSHDMHLEGLLRRDVEYREGYDIVIGRGVWLGSGCMILGPCEIGDNAVIAAGAVVTPGTKVPAGQVWGGIPARCLKDIETVSAETVADPHIMEAIDRAQGALFAIGWSEKKYIGLHAGKVWGHFAEDETGLIYTNLADLHLIYQAEEEAEIILQTDAATMAIPTEETEGRIAIHFAKEGLHVIRVTGGKGCFFGAADRTSEPETGYLEEKGIDEIHFDA